MPSIPVMCLFMPELMEGVEACSLGGYVYDTRRQKVPVDLSPGWFVALAQQTSHKTGCG